MIKVSENTPSNSLYFKQINGFRTILFFAIIIYHFCFHYFGNESNGFVPDISIVWACFFFLSGYFLKIKNTKAYWEGKIVRTIIPFWISVLFIWLVSKIADKTYCISIKDMLYNCILFPVFTSTPFVDGAHWFVMQLIYFHILFWIVIKCDSVIYKLSKRRDTEHVFVRWAILLYGLISVLLSYISSDSRFVILLNCIFKPRLVFICFGFLSNSKLKNIQTKVQQFVILIVIFFYFIRYQNFINYIYFIILLFLVRLIMLSKIGLLEHKLFQLLGTYSLYIYLVHQTIGYIIISHSPNVVLGIVLAFVYSICAGLIFGVTYNKLIKSRLLANH